ncbi:MarR family winged helix-turn-helix transcriptional regulator [Actinoplanes sp. GCM10030250]|uniref:MarR family winged helix-turn-helix transcriptional regulator n=1 Tax=Actinoplanes sp. GCM10030250 TaxID=3273376 RepID=UPI0036230EBA
MAAGPLRCGDRRGSRRGGQADAARTRSHRGQGAQSPAGCEGKGQPAATGPRDRRGDRGGDREQTARGRLGHVPVRSRGDDVDGARQCGPAQQQSGADRRDSGQARCGRQSLLALKHLLVADTPLGPVDLGRLLGLTSGAATGLVDRLQRAGWVRREPHPDDRRRQIVIATAQARQTMLRELRPLAEEIGRTADGLSPDQRRLVTNALLNLALLDRQHAREL